MKVTFYKYQGTGNDFIMIDDRANQFDENDVTLISQLCHRRFGIGADGLILLRNHEQSDFEMVYFNSDGKQTSMCGNGGRCIVKFAHHLGLISDKTSFHAIDGVHEASIEDGIVHLKMNDVKEMEMGKDFFVLDTGSPHYVKWIGHISDYDVINEAKLVRYSARFCGNGINVNFVEKQADQSLFVRTYERGVEDETLSCGTGVTAAALVYGSMGGGSPVSIRTMGGQLKISFKKTDKGYSDIFLIGPADKVYQGELQVG